MAKVTKVATYCSVLNKIIKDLNLDTRIICKVITHTVMSLTSLYGYINIVK